jgi:hypothetical protein
MPTNRETIESIDMTFGAEFECYLPSDFARTLHPRGGGILPPGWIAKGDGSLSSNIPGYTGIEIVSPILKGAEGMAQVAQVARIIRRNRGKVNQTCGFHVHVGMRLHDESDEAVLGRLVCLVARHEGGLLASTGAASRLGNLFCKSIKTDSDYIWSYKDKPHAKLRDSSIGDRYYTLNLTNLKYQNKPTVEFRAFQGTTSAVKAVAWIRLCLGMVERCHISTRRSSWDAPLPPALVRDYHDAPHAGNMHYLMSDLGWNGNHRFGPGKRPGIFDCPPEVPSFDECRKELKRLAKKLDAVTGHAGSDPDDE